MSEIEGRTGLRGRASERDETIFWKERNIRKSWEE